MLMHMYVHLLVHIHFLLFIRWQTASRHLEKPQAGEAEWARPFDMCKILKWVGLGSLHMGECNEGIRYIL